MTDHPTYIVTGGAGFIGSSLIAALLRRVPRPRIIVIDSFRSGSFVNLIAACRSADVGPFDGRVIPASSSSIDFEKLLSAGNVHALFHLGAITDTTLTDQPEMVRENVSGFAEMMHACTWRRIPLVYASSAATYGSPPQARDRIPFPLDAAGHPDNIYGFSKWMMECEHRRFTADHIASGGAEPHIIGLRYFNVFGPGEASKGTMASMVYQLAMQLLSGRRPRIFTDGAQARDQIYIDDVVECTLAAAGLSPTGEQTAASPRPGIYNLGSGTATTFNDIIAALRRGLEISERKQPTEYFDMPPDIRAFYQTYTCADITETRRALHWSPRYNPADAIATCAAILKSR